MDFRSLKTERILFIWNTLHAISLCQYSVLKVLIWSEVKIKDKAHGILIVSNFNVNQMFQDRLIMILNHVSKELNILEDCQPKLWNTFHVFFLSFTFNCNLVLHVFRKFFTFLVII